MKTSLLGLVLLGAGCTSQLSQISFTSQPGALARRRADDDRALVIFMRPGSWGAASRLPGIWHKDTFVAMLPPRGCVAYEVDGGEQLFMLDGGEPDFLPAQLESGRTYYVGLASRYKGWWFRPISPEDPETEQSLDAWLEGCRTVEVNEEGKEWLSRRAPKIPGIRERYYKEWLERAPEKQKRIKAAWGR